jgi:hypothetical protein
MNINFLGVQMSLTKMAGNDRAQKMCLFTDDELQNFLLSRNVKKKIVTELIRQGLDGQMLFDFKAKDFEQLGIPKAPVIQILNIRDNFLSETPQGKKQRGERQIVRPFNKPIPANFTYKKGNFIDHEVGASSLFEPAREFKSIIDTDEKFIGWVKKFVIGCLNRSTNGTIYFGVQDTEHGLVTGINMSNSNFDIIQDLVDKNFVTSDAAQFLGVKEKIMKDAVSMCLKPVRFIPVEGGEADEELFVIEIDVEASWNVCQEMLFYAKTKHGPYEFYIRRGAHAFTKRIDQKLSHLDPEMLKIEKEVKNYRKERYRQESDLSIQIENFDTKLRRLVCQGRQRVEDEEFRYFLLYNKPADGDNLEDFQWISKIKWAMVLDFDEDHSFFSLAAKDHDLMRKPKLLDVSSVRNLENSEDLRKTVSFGEYTSWLQCNKDGKDLKEWNEDEKRTIVQTFEFLTDAKAVEDLRKIVLIIILSSSESIDKISYIMKDLNTSLAQNQFVCFYKDPQVLVKLEHKIGDIFYGDVWNSQKVHLTSWNHLSCFFAEKTKLIFKKYGMQFPSSSPGLNVRLNSTFEDYHKKEGIDILGSKHCEQLSDEYNIDELTFFANCEILSFFKGSEPTWELFYFSNPSSLPVAGKIFPGVIKREYVDNLIKDVEELNKYQNTIVARKRIIHQPGAGASTIGKHILWIQVKYLNPQSLFCQQTVITSGLTRNLSWVHILNQAGIHASILI